MGRGNGFASHGQREVFNIGYLADETLPWKAPVSLMGARDEKHELEHPSYLMAFLVHLGL